MQTKVIIYGFDWRSGERWDGNGLRKGRIVVPWPLTSGGGGGWVQGVGEPGRMGGMRVQKAGRRGKGGEQSGGINRQQCLRRNPSGN